MWSRIRNINYHQILAHPLNETTTTLCGKVHRLFLISETYIYIYIYAVNCCSQLQHTANCAQQTKLMLSAKFCALCSFHYEPVRVLKYEEKAETQGKDPLTQFDAKVGKLHSAVKLCGCVSAGIWLMQILLWIGCWNGADCAAKAELIVVILVGAIHSLWIWPIIYLACATC